MKASTYACLLGLALLVMAGGADAQGFFSREVNIDYYLMNYFNRVSPIPDYTYYGGIYRNHYAFVNLVAPQFFYSHHNLDFASVEQSTRTGSMGGAGVGFVEGATALAINPAGLARGDHSELYFAGIANFGGGSGGLVDRIVFDTGQVGQLSPADVSPEPRFSERHNGLYLSLRPFGDTGRSTGFGALLDRAALAVGYRRFVEIGNSTNLIARWDPVEGAGGFEENFKSASQAIEKGGIDAFVVGIATGMGDVDSDLTFRVGGAVNFASGRTRSEQVFTVTQLTQIRLATRGGYVNQKFEATALDLGAQASLFGGALSLGAAYRPEYTLEMPEGRYLHRELLDLGVIYTTYGRISGYDLELPATSKAGLGLRLDRLIGDGTETRGILGYFHRFFGRGLLAADVVRCDLSQAVVRQRSDSLSNPGLEDEFELITLLAVNDAVYGDTLAAQGFVLRPTMPLLSGDANLRDQRAIRLGIETLLWDRPDYQVHLRLGYEQVPFSFPSLKMKAIRDEETGEMTRTVDRYEDNTPKLEDVTGDAVTFGLGYRAGSVSFEAGVRFLSVEFVQWWEGSGRKSWWDPLTGEYGVPAPNDDQYALMDDVFAGANSAMDVRRRLRSFQVSASLAF